MKKVEQCLALLNGKINKRGLKTRKAIEQAAQQIIEEHKLENFFHISIGTITEKYQVQIGTGRPGKNTKYSTRVNTLYTLSWTQKISGVKRRPKPSGPFAKNGTILKSKAS